MEDGSLSHRETEEIKENGIDTPIMANSFIEREEAAGKINGNSIEQLSNPEDYSSESDALVIDESVPPIRKTKSSNKEKNKKKNDQLVHFNPYFNESLFELSQQHHHHQTTNNSVDEPPPQTTSAEQAKSNGGARRAKPKSNPKLREYAQYLGLQPTVQFKCWRCGRAGFESLTTLNQHVVQCTDEPASQPPIPDSSSSSFKLTRKVFLCSACGTYYENWNLYLHMIEVHRRYLCLYCLGMFSVLDDLCVHIQSRHNLEPGHKDSIDDFFTAYKDPCYIVCCECNKLFSEQDNFFYHTCARKEPPLNNKIANNNNKLLLNKTTAASKNSNKIQQQRPQEHVTGDSTSTAATTTAIKNGDSSLILKEIVSHELITKETQQISSDDRQHSVNIDEIIYSSDDDELNLRGFNELGEAIFLDDKPQPTPPPPPPAPSQPEEEEEESKVSDEAAEEEEEEYDEEVDEEEEDDEEEAAAHNQSVMDEEDEDEQEAPIQMEEEPVETRKVPKLSLKLKLGSFPQIQNEENIEQTEEPKNEPEDDEEEEEEHAPVAEEALEEEEEEDQQESSTELVEQQQEQNEPQIKVAGDEIAVVELELEQPLDKFDARILLQKCLKATAPVCIYCNHARKIAVDGKQLGLHAIAEHRFSAVVSSITAEELIPESFVARIKDSLSELEGVFFSLESGPSDEAVTFSHQFECFQCRYSTNIHKELYLHNRKLHAKNLLLCIMCKSNFYSYSELISHMCPGVYVLDSDVTFRCCMCVGDDLPSAFRLMVHLRKRHHVCDVCLEMCHSQYRLSNHVWKHKLHHFCYRCGIAYRNKPDITRHLFWKHGTESVLCKKCLQKKWPHVYHFCVPPASFLCEECNLSFSKAVALKVHKRIHSDEKPHACSMDECSERFISKKLLAKHENKHREPQQNESPQAMEEVQVEVGGGDETAELKKSEDGEKKAESEAKTEAAAEESRAEPVKPKVDVYDLPALNLSESDSSESEAEEEAKKVEIAASKESTEANIIVEEAEAEAVDVVQEMLEEETIVEEELQHEQTTQAVETPILENIWDDFKNYQANKEKFDNLLTENTKEMNSSETVGEEVVNEPLTVEIALRDHDYCIDPERKPDISFTEVKPDLSQSVDHDYCSAKDPAGVKEDAGEKETKEMVKVKEQETKTKNSNSSSSDSSSDSDSSSCSCGPNCSCSSSSGSSSSSSESSDSDSSTEEGRKRQQVRRDKRRQKKQKGGANSGVKPPQTQKPSEVVAAAAAVPLPVIIPEMPIQESDLDTTETDTDEEFYDKQPQKLAKKILEEKRNQLLAGIQTPNGVNVEAVAVTNSRAPTPNLPEIIEQETVAKSSRKKSKSKKKKKRKSERRELESSRLAAVAAAAAAAAPPAQHYYSYYQQQPPAAALPPITLTLTRNSPVASPSSGKLSAAGGAKSSADEENENLRASKRRRVPNKFYGYSSDEEEEKTKWRKTSSSAEANSVSYTAATVAPLVVPPITIKAVQAPASIPPIHRPPPPPRLPPIKLKPQFPVQQQRVDVEAESEAESNDSSNEGRNMLQVNPDALYCYCKCPYDEVSEMIGCDSRDCSIEWFHFECVGIMVPPKGHWYCPECRKKRQQKREMLKVKSKMAAAGT